MDHLLQCEVLITKTCILQFFILTSVLEDKELVYDTLRLCIRGFLNYSYVGLYMTHVFVF